MSRNNDILLVVGRVQKIYSVYSVVLNVVRTANRRILRRKAIATHVVLNLQDEKKFKKHSKFLWYKDMINKKK